VSLAAHVRAPTADAGTRAADAGVRTDGDPARTCGVRVWIADVASVRAACLSRAMTRIMGSELVFSVPVRRLFGTR